MNRKTLTAALLATAALGASAALSPAIAAGEGFSSQEGFTASGAPEWRFEVDPYLWLPTTSVNVGLGLLPDKNVSVPVGNVLSHFTGGFMGEGIARYGNWSAEMNLFWISVGKNKDVTIPDTEGDTVNVRLHSGAFAISPGFAYRLDHTDKISFDARVGFTYFAANASAHIQNSPEAGVSRTADFAQPWIGERWRKRGSTAKPPARMRMQSAKATAWLRRGGSACLALENLGKAAVAGAEAGSSGRPRISGRASAADFGVSRS